MKMQCSFLGHPAQKIHLMPCLNPFSKIFKHLFLLETKNIKNERLLEKSYEFSVDIDCCHRILFFLLDTLY